VVAYLDKTGAIYLPSLVLQKIVPIAYLSAGTSSQATPIATTAQHLPQSFFARPAEQVAPELIGLLTGLAEWKRSLILERTKESVEHRRRTGGNLAARPKASDNKERQVIRLREDGESYRSIRDQRGVSLAKI